MLEAYKVQWWLGLPKQELEDKMLRLLKEAKGNILDDEVLINTLNNSKLTAAMIQNRVREAEQTENNINQVWCASTQTCLLLMYI